MSDKSKDFDPQFVDAARRFFLDVIHEEEDGRLPLADTLYRHFPDMPRTIEAERSALRYLGANFFRIVGVKQPSTSRDYNRTIERFKVEEEARQVLLDESPRLVGPEL